jgi:PTH1 family peptidyl-tRNA hydrolase
VRVVVGLGNPGPRYADTRHNIGFRVAEALAGTQGWSTAAAAQTATVVIGDEEVLLVKPQTYMNRSGDVVRAAHEQIGFEPEDVLVVFDDFLLDFGRVRLRRSGSDGGHNGLASVLERLQTDQVARLRLGVGPVPEGTDDIDFVLTDFAATDDVDGLVARGSAATHCWLRSGIAAAMNRFNGCPALGRDGTKADRHHDNDMQEDR